MLEFCNHRRRAVRKATPNAAHHAIASLENTNHQVTVVTQNIDDLHERAGSRHVLHLHGEILKSRSDHDPQTLYDCPGDLHPGDIAPGGGQLRPHVVFFGEAVWHYDDARSVCKRADILVVVGTSLVVYPAAYLVQESTAGTVYAIDPAPINTARFGWEGRRIISIQKTASEGVPEAIARIIGATTG